MTKIMWSLTWPQATATGGVTLSKDVTTSRSGFGIEKLEELVPAVLAQFDPSLRELAYREMKLEMWIKMELWDALPDV